MSRRALRRGYWPPTFRPALVRSIAMESNSSSSNSAATQSKREGTIADAFASLSGQEFKPLEPRFATLKTDLLRGNEEAIVASWHRLLAALREETARVAALGSSVIPQIHFDDIESPSEAFSAEFKKRGVAVIRGTLPEADALQLKWDLRDYLALNPHTKAFPADRPAVYELYWSPSQIRARAHPRMLAAQRFALSHWHSANANAPVSTSTPVSYADRLRMRQPGDTQFALGPHVDGGSCERWEPRGYGLGGVYDAVFRGRWEDLDQWEASCRLPVVSDLYNGVGACSAFRMCQGWLSISHVAPREGTLLANPMLKLATAYYLLRPFFTPRLPAPMTIPDHHDPAPPGTGVAVDDAYTEEFLSADNWVLEGGLGDDVASSSSNNPPITSWLQGATPGHGQELRAALHPHLDLGRTMVHVPAVAPGDYVLWHCDTIHSVDAEHRGRADSSVLYIPACPLTPANAAYLARQRAAFTAGVPSPDFPGGEGESAHRARPTAPDVHAAGGLDAARAMGLAPWDPNQDGLTPGERDVMVQANEILGFN